MRISKRDKKIAREVAILNGVVNRNKLKSNCDSVDDVVALIKNRNLTIRYKGCI